MLVNFVHAILVAPGGHVHPRHHASNVQRVQWVVFVLRLVQQVLRLQERKIFPRVMHVSIEHGVSPVSPIPSEEGIMSKHQSGAISKVLLLVCLYLQELILELVAVQKLIVVVSKYQVFLSIQVLQYPNGCLHVIARDVPKYEHMVILLHHSIPILHQYVVIVLWTVQLVVRECQVILGSANGIGVSLIPKVDVGYVKAISQSSVSFQL